MATDPRLDEGHDIAVLAAEGTVTARSERSLSPFDRDGAVSGTMSCHPAAVLETALAASDAGARKA